MCIYIYLYIYKYIYVYIYMENLHALSFFFFQTVFPKKQNIHIPHAISSFLRLLSVRNSKSRKCFRLRVEVGT